jgi:hypothetical protein
MQVCASACAQRVCKPNTRQSHATAARQRTAVARPQRGTAVAKVGRQEEGIETIEQTWWGWHTRRHTRTQIHTHTYTLTHTRMPHTHVTHTHMPRTHVTHTSHARTHTHTHTHMPHTRHAQASHTITCRALVPNQSSGGDPRRILAACVVRKRRRHGGRRRGLFLLLVLAEIRCGMNGMRKNESENAQTCACKLDNHHMNG